MPPRKGGGKKGGKKLDPEQAKAAFEAYKTSDEGKRPPNYLHNILNPSV
jgi:hypothetical protein